MTLRTLLVLALALSLLPVASALSTGAGDAPAQDTREDPGPPCVRRTAGGGVSTHVDECLAEAPS